MNLKGNSHSWYWKRGLLHQWQVAIDEEKGKLKLAWESNVVWSPNLKKVFRKNLNETHFWYNIPIHFPPNQVHVTETSRNSSTHTFANCGDQENKSSMFIYVQEWYITFFFWIRQANRFPWLQKISVTIFMPILLSVDEKIPWINHDTTMKFGNK